MRQCCYQIGLITEGLGFKMGEILFEDIVSKINYNYLQCISMSKLPKGQICEITLMSLASVLALIKVFKDVQTELGKSSSDS